MSSVLVMESTYENCREAVDRAFSHYPVDVRGKKVAVKMNALRVCEPDQQAFVTHYKLVEAVIQKLESLHPTDIVAGDSVGTPAYGNSDHVFETTRLKEVTGPYYRNFSKNLKVITLDKPFKRKVAVLKDVLDADIYVSIPKMKTHGLAVISGAIKNNYGILTGGQKAWYHCACGRVDRFAEVLVELYRLRTPDLVIMDAILAMEGYGPASPETRWVNKVLASDDGVALDTVQAEIIGFNVEEIPCLRVARKMGIGETDMEAIEVIGDAATIRDYHRPVPPATSYCYQPGVGSGRPNFEFFQRLAAYRPFINREKCRHRQGCSLCVDICPSGALTGGDPIPSLDASKCMTCCACREVCDVAGLELLTNEAIMESKPYAV